jgi:hypothetical protein
MALDGLDLLCITPTIITHPGITDPAEATMALDPIPWQVDLVDMQTIIQDQGKISIIDPEESAV